MTHIHTYTSITAVLQDFKWRMLEIKCTGYLSGVRYKLLAYGPAYATATPSSLAALKSSLA